MPQTLDLDQTDQQLLDLLQRDCAKTLFELGRQVGLSTSAVQRRIRRYHRAGLIRRQVAVLDPAAVGDLVFALVLVTLERESSELHRTLRSRIGASPAVQQVYDLAGEWDYAVIFVAHGMHELREIVDGLFMDAPNVKRFDTFPVYEVVKMGSEIPIRARLLPSADTA